MPDDSLDALTSRAASLVEAAKRAGADAADAVVVSGVSLSVSVRDGKIEDNERAEGDQLGLRVFVGKRNAIVSASNTDKDALKRLVERAIAMAKAAPEDAYAGLAERHLLASAPPHLDMIDDSEPSAADLTEAALTAEAAGLAVKGVTKSGGADAR